MGLFKWLFTRRYNAKNLQGRFLNNTWITDPGNNNLEIHLQAARWLGITKPIHSWQELGRGLGMMTAWGMPSAVQEALFAKIAENIKVPPLPKKAWERTARPDVEGIATKLGLQVLAPVSQIPKDFIIFAFVDYKSRQ